MVEEKEEKDKIVKEADNQKNKKGWFGILVTIVFTGFLTGLFYGISNKWGYNLSADSILVSTVGSFCTSINNLLSSSVTSSSSTSCGINFSYVAWILTALGIIEIIFSISKLKNWFLGIIVFGIGWIIGYVIV